MKDIAIIGGGATGTATLIALLKAISKQKQLLGIKITVFEPKEEMGLGLAYSAPLSSILLNTSVGSTTIVAGDNKHFANWLSKNESLWKPLFPEITSYNLESFLPRSLCGLYIKETLKNALSKQDPKRVVVQHVRQKVTGIKLSEQAEKPFTIFTTGGAHLSDGCVLATGYGQGYSHTYSYLSENKNYCASPYLCFEQIKKISPHEKVLIVGTGLSAIDAALILKNHPNVTLTSRRGFIPAVRNRIIATEPKHLTEHFQEKFFKDNAHRLGIEQVRKEIEIELSYRLNKKIVFNEIEINKNTVRQLREDIGAARKKNNSWEDSIFCILGFIDRAWGFLSLVDQKQLITHEMKLISRYISSFPFGNAKLFYEKIKSGSLTLRNNLSNIYIDGEKFRAEFYGKTAIETEQYDHVVNATPVDKYITMLPGLYLNLIEHEIIQRNHFGGVLVSPQCEIINAFKKLPFFAAGPITKGSFLITNLLATSAKQAEIIAQLILNKP